MEKNFFEIENDQEKFAKKKRKIFRNKFTDDLNAFLIFQFLISFFKKNIITVK